MSQTKSIPDSIYTAVTKKLPPLILEPTGIETAVIEAAGDPGSPSSIPFKLKTTEQSQDKNSLDRTLLTLDSAEILRRLDHIK